VIKYTYGNTQEDYSTFKDMLFKNFDILLLIASMLRANSTVSVIV